MYVEWPRIDKNPLVRMPAWRKDTTIQSQQPFGGSGCIVYALCSIYVDNLDAGPSNRFVLLFNTPNKTRVMR